MQVKTLAEIDIKLHDGQSVTLKDFLDNFFRVLNFNNFVGVMVLTNEELSERDRFKFVGNFATEKDAAEILMKASVSISANRGNNALEDKVNNPLGEAVAIVGESSLN